MDRMLLGLQRLPLDSLQNTLQIKIVGGSISSMSGGLPTVVFPFE